MNPFHYRRPTAAQVDQIEAVRAKFAELHDVIQQHVPAGRELALVVTKMQEAGMWANAGIVFAPGPHAPVLSSPQAEAEGPEATLRAWFESKMASPLAMAAPSEVEDLLTETEAAISRAFGRTPTPPDFDSEAWFARRSASTGEAT